MVGYERKLLTLVGLIALALLPILAAALYFLSTISASQDRLDALYTRTVILAQELRVEKMKQNSLVPVIVITGDRALLGRLSASNRKFQSILGDLRAVARDADADRALDTVADLQRRLVAVEGPGIAQRLAGGSTAEVNAYFQRNAGPHTRDMNVTMDRFIEQASARYQAERVRNQRLLHGVFWVLALGSAAALAFCAYVGWHLLRLVEQKSAFDQISAKLAQREKEISKARKEAVEVVSHDLNNPITTILFATENLLVRPEMAALPKVKSSIESILLATETMRRLIRNILDHSKIEAGGLVLSKENVDLRSLLADIADQFALSAARKGVDFSQAYSDSDTVLQADGARIEQVVGNLLANAIKFTAPGGSVSLSSEVLDDLVVVQVKDTGWGMTAEQVDRIFDRYWQADEAAPLGTGLGLTISKAIVEAHGGRLGIDTRPGEGSTFKVILPLAA